jgi:hypothetical protein
MSTPLRFLLSAASLAWVMVLTACGGGNETAPPPEMASTSDVAALSTQPGVTPFIGFVKLTGLSLVNLASIRYTIEAKTGTISKPVDVSYTMAALQRRGYVTARDATLTLPVFGLYAGQANRVLLQLKYADNSIQALPLSVTTASYTDPKGIYDRPNMIKRRAAGSTLGFDFFAIKSGVGTPVVVDTDGEVRWVGIGIADGGSSAFQDNGFVVGDQVSTSLTRLELDGTFSHSTLISPFYTNFHHNIEQGKSGLLAEVDANNAGIISLETNLVEITSAGSVVSQWDFAALLASYMRTHGDDPSLFIRPGIDWFHMNAAIYDPRDNSLIVSSRENFVIKVDYASGDLIWILGDPTKYWYGFSSLRAKALTLEGGGLYPIGQHAVSVSSDGLLMLFNDGAASFNQPAMAPAGESRAYSAVSAYAIDATRSSAKEVWRFDHDKTILSDICSSAYEASGKSILIDYSAAGNRKTARLVGLDANHDVVFDFEYASPAPCKVGWNAIPVPFEQLRFE